MKTFIASVEERYTWTCPHCGEMCGDPYDDPQEYGPVTCEHCNKESECSHVER